jgi:site-specific recombinase XerD
MGSTNLVINDLFERYLETLEETHSESFATRRSHLRNIAKYINCSESAEDFVNAIADRVTAYKIAVPKRGSHAPAISTLRMALRWAYSERLLPISQDLSASLGMPPVALFANWREYQQAPSVYKALLSEMQVGQVTLDDLDETFFEKFLGEMPSRLVAWRAGWREFRICWAIAAAEGYLPVLELPHIPSRKRKPYRIAVDDLPEQLASELANIQNRLCGSDLAERRGVQPYEDSTINLLIDSLMRLTGFLVQERGMVLHQLSSFAAILTVEHGLALMHHVNNQWMEESGIPPEIRRSMGLGEYEIGLLRQFAALARGGIRDDSLHGAFMEEISYLAQQARGRREKVKNPGYLNDYYRVAVELARRGMEGTDADRGDIRRATFIRDAVALGLFATFGYRISVLTNLKLDEHIRRGESGETIICIRKETTKPGLRDLVHEVPQEMIPLIEYYLNGARQVLLRGMHDHGSLFVSAHDGSPLGTQAVYAMFITRTADILGEVHNPHQVRKAWASGWARWTRGDYMTASSILDNSPLTIQQSYARIIREEQVADFDNATRADWEQVKGGWV